MILAWIVVAFFIWAVVYGLVFHEKGPTYEFFAKLLRRLTL